MSADQSKTTMQDSGSTLHGSMQDTAGCGFRAGDVILLPENMPGLPEGTGRTYRILATAPTSITVAPYTAPRARQDRPAYRAIELRKQRRRRR